VLDLDTKAQFEYADIRPNGQDFAQLMQASVARSVVAQEQMVEEQAERSKSIKIK
jgi:hypothetical protein